MWKILNFLITLFTIARGLILFYVLCKYEKYTTTNLEKNVIII